MKDLRREHWSRVTKEETSARKEKWKSAFSGKLLNSVQKETLAVSVMREYLETGTIKDKKHRHPLLLEERRPRLTEGRNSSPRAASPSGLKGRKPC